MTALPCLCATLRRTSRAVTQLYDDALRPVGLRATQFTLLQALSLTGETKQLALSQMLAIDSTTLTRTLATMTRDGWLRRRRGDDRREWYFRLSRDGEVQFARAVPLWRGVQTELRALLGQQASDQLLALANRLTEQSTNRGEE